MKPLGEARTKVSTFYPQSKSSFLKNQDVYSMKDHLDPICHPWSFP